MSECPHHKKNRQKHDFAIISIVPLMLTIFILMRVWRGGGGVVEDLVSAIICMAVHILKYRADILY